MRSRQEINNEITKSLGIIPDWLNILPDEQLEHIWAMQSWLMKDTSLNARDKTLVAFGAAAAIHCPYVTQFFMEQLKLDGMSDPAIHEAALSALQSTGLSAYLHGINYNTAKWNKELDQIVSCMELHPGGC
jgi:alkylhydroperoxidase/carboxymuconolactone decarboxylase family protein YurZ